MERPVAVAMEDLHGMTAPIGHHQVLEAVAVKVGAGEVVGIGARPENRSPGKAAIGGCGWGGPKACSTRRPAVVAALAHEAGACTDLELLDERRGQAVAAAVLEPGAQRHAHVARHERPARHSVRHHRPRRIARARHRVHDVIAVPEDAVGRNPDLDVAHVIDRRSVHVLREPHLERIQQRLRRGALRRKAGGCNHRRRGVGPRQVEDVAPRKATPAVGAHPHEAGARRRQQPLQGRPRCRRGQDRARGIQEIEPRDQGAVGGRLQGRAHRRASTQVAHLEHIAGVHRSHMPGHARPLDAAGQHKRNRRRSAHAVRLVGIPLERQPATTQAHPCAVFAPVIVSPPPRNAHAHGMDAVLGQHDRVRREAARRARVRSHDRRSRGTEDLDVELAATGAPGRLRVDLQHVARPRGKPEPILVLVLFHRAAHQDGRQPSRILCHIKATRAQPQRDAPTVVGRSHVAHAVPIPVTGDDANRVVVARQCHGYAQNPAHLVEVTHQPVASISAHHHVHPAIRIQVVHSKEPWLRPRSRVLHGDVEGSVATTRKDPHALVAMLDHDDVQAPVTRQVAEPNAAGVGGHRQGDRRTQSPRAVVAIDADGGVPPIRRQNIHAPIPIDIADRQRPRTPVAGDVHAPIGAIGRSTENGQEVAASIGHHDFRDPIGVEVHEARHQGVLSGCHEDGQPKRHRPHVAHHGHAMVVMVRQDKVVAPVAIHVAHLHARRRAPRRHVQGLPERAVAPSEEHARKRLPVARHHQVIDAIAVEVARGQLVLAARR